ncbi:MAG: poly-gamma-glutamate hydrolase family protein [Cyanobacteriota bacterium]
MLSDRYKTGLNNKNNIICLENDQEEKNELAGTKETNIVNQNKNEKGRLQIELNEIIRNDLAEGIDNPDSNSPDKSQVLRNVIFNAIKEAMND